MAWTGAESLERLQRALDRFDRVECAQIAEDLVCALRDAPAKVPVAETQSALKKLRRKRHFDLMERVADAAIQTGAADVVVRRLYVQSLLDQGRLTAAIGVLDGLIEATREEPAENAEARGLLGRAYKQLYVDAGGSPNDVTRRYLERAVDAYYGVYRSDPSRYTWQGINTVALLLRARRDGLSPADAPDPLELAQQILAKIQDKHDSGGDDTWDRGTAAEACVALERPTTEIVRWLGWYAFGGADAFELFSTERQFREVWGLRLDQSPGREVFSILRAALLRSQGGHAQIGSEALDTGSLAELGKTDLEALLGQDGLQTYSWYLTGLERCRIVGRVERLTGEPAGTGFLVPGRLLSPALRDEPLLLTNAHVVTTDARLLQTLQPQPLRPDQAQVVFYAASSRATRPRKHAVATLLWSSPRLDASLLRLEQPPARIPSCPIGVDLPVVGQTPPPRVYVIGHPQGGELSVSLNDNLFLGYEQSSARIHYRAPTEEGSSGSPVFNRSWELIGLHHGGGKETRRLAPDVGTYPANEGFWIQAIREELGRALGRRRARVAAGRRAKGGASRGRPGRR